jgi:hypothetical protein
MCTNTSWEASVLEHVGYSEDPWTQKSVIKWEKSPHLLRFRPGAPVFFVFRSVQLASEDSSVGVVYDFGIQIQTDRPEYPLHSTALFTQRVLVLWTAALQAWATDFHRSRSGRTPLHDAAHSFSVPSFLEPKNWSLVADRQYPTDENGAYFSRCNAKQQKDARDAYASAVYQYKVENKIKTETDKLTLGCQPPRIVTRSLPPKPFLLIHSVVRFQNV